VYPKFVLSIVVLGLIAPPLFPRTFAQVAPREASFQSLNFPDRYIRHRNSLGYVEPISDDLGKMDATWEIVPGLAGRCSSLESLNNPGHFLRHQGSRLKLAPFADDQLFRQDASFCMVPGLADVNATSFESVNYPHHFVRHRNFELWLDPFDGSDLFRRDATFRSASPVGRKSIPRRGRAEGELMIPLPPEVMEPSLKEGEVRVVVRYPKEYGDMAATVSACNAFSVMGATVLEPVPGGFGSEREVGGSYTRRGGVPISYGNYWLCSATISSLPLNRQLKVYIRVHPQDVWRTGQWTGGNNTQPPPRYERAIKPVFQSVTLTARRPSEMVMFDMVYAPPPSVPR
jgi:hypothetical protein